MIWFDINARQMPHYATAICLLIWCINSQPVSLTRATLLQSSSHVAAIYKISVCLWVMDLLWAHNNAIELPFALGFGNRFALSKHPLIEFCQCWLICNYIEFYIFYNFLFIWCVVLFYTFPASSMYALTKYHSRNNFVFSIFKHYWHTKLI